MAKVTFKGGIHPPEYKDFSEHKPIEMMPLPQQVVVPLVQHIGAPCKPVVKVGDKVKVGQKIGEAGGFVSAPIHAPVAGTITKVAKLEVSDGQLVDCIVIENDGTDDWDSSLEAHASLDEVSAKEIVEIVREAGIVGLGGAGFPTHVKLSPPPELIIDSVILNGAECEPFLTCDHRLMLEYSEKVVKGLLALMKAVSAAKGYIAIESNKPDAIETMQAAVRDYPHLEVVTLETKYPQGAEKQLIAAVLGREVPSGKLPMHVGVIVNNIHTAYAVAEAVFEGKPLVQRVVTVSGSVVKNPKNLMVRLGTSFQELIDYCGGFSAEPAKVIKGGPMTGFAQYRLDVPVGKRVSGIIALSAAETDLEEEGPCIKCARCVDACPAFLMPNQLDKLSRRGEFDKAQELGALDCIECAACTFVCPAKRMIIQSIKLAKNEIRAKMRG